MFFYAKITMCLKTFRPKFSFAESNPGSCCSRFRFVAIGVIPFGLLVLFNANIYSDIKVTAYLHETQVLSRAAQLGLILFTIYHLIYHNLMYQIPYTIKVKAYLHETQVLSRSAPCGTVRINLNFVFMVSYLCTTRNSCFQ
jgi:hypothetical protein